MKYVVPLLLLAKCPCVAMELKVLPPSHFKLRLRFLKNPKESVVLDLIRRCVEHPGGPLGF